MSEPQTPWIRRLADLATAAVPPPDRDAGAVDFVRRRLATMPPGEVEILCAAATADTDSPAGEVVSAWADAPAHTVEAGWFVAIRRLGWEALLADPRHGGDRDAAGWRLFGYRGRPKSRP